MRRVPTGGGAGAMLRTVIGSKSGRILVGVVVFVGLFVAGEAAAGGATTATSPEAADVWRTFGNILSALGGAALAYTTARSHMANRAIHPTAKDLDATYVRKDGVDSLGEKFVTKDTCHILNDHLCETLREVKATVERVEDKVDQITTR